MTEWVRTHGYNIPDHAVEAGYESNGQVLFVARAYYDGGWVPGKAGFHIPGCHIPYGGEEIIMQDYEVLVFRTRDSGFIDWQMCSNGQVPESARPFCCHPSHALYPARAYYAGGLHPGKLHTSHGCTYISYGGKEIPIKEYEVLCQIK